MVLIRTITTILTYVIGLCGMIPLFPWLAITPRLILVAGVLAGLWQDRNGRWQMKPWQLNCTVAAVFMYYALQFSRTNPVQPVISVLAVMLAVRMSGEKTVRYSLQIYALSTFCLASSSLFDLSPVFLIYLTVLLVTVALATVLLTFQDQDSAMIVSLANLKIIFVSALLMPTLAIPLLLFFFPIMPRTQLPLWHFLTPPATRISGYSDSVEPGSQSSVVSAQSLAFRAEMPPQAQVQLYWRGTVFNRTDGIRWTRVISMPDEQPEMNGRRIRQTIYREPSAASALVALDRPAAVALQRVKRSPDGVFEIIGRVGTRIHYTSDSVINENSLPRILINRSFYLQVPSQLPPRITALAERVVRSGESDRTRITFLENYFRNGNYNYSTKDLITGDKAIEQFLFEKKRGHCEFFASSFALVLRAAGIPCRLVGGYLGGEYNQLGGYYIVTDGNAHVWVEAFIDGSGWQRIDPSGFAANAGNVWQKSDTRGLGHRISLVLDSFNHSWNRMVIPYDFEQQINVLNSISTYVHEIRSSRILLNVAPYAVGVIVLTIILTVQKRIAFSAHVSNAFFIVFFVLWKINSESRQNWAG
ncbi:MAG: DUF3488 and transglutaminase-like domain-containing protein [Desulfuromonadaceae bacterium]|nr:DUF3488 and transglutaminase-like domain-containing protein [Desulfuromonadaceae bacterium]